MPRLRDCVALLCVVFLLGCSKSGARKNPQLNESVDPPGGGGAQVMGSVPGGGINSGGQELTCPPEDCAPEDCKAGVCAGSCTPGATRCADSRNRQVCGDDGSWSEPSRCEDQACLASMSDCGGECLPGATRCSPSGGEEVQTCTEMGQWGSGVACEGKTCNSGRCESPPVTLPECESVPSVADAFLDAPATSSDIVVSVETSQVNGVAPLAVFFDATATTHSDSSLDPFHQLHYQWYFHDDAEYSGGTWKYSCRSKRTAEGPLAAHVFDEPGVYPVRLAVRDATGNVSTTTIEITVEDTASFKTVCFADISGNGGDFAGCPLDDDGDGTCDRDTSRCVDTTDFYKRFDSEIGPKTKILFRRGDTFSTSFDLRRQEGGDRILGAFGDPSGQRPILQFTSGNDRNDAFQFRQGSEGMRVMDLILRASDGHNRNPFELVNASDVLVYRVETQGWLNCLYAPHESGEFQFFSHDLFMVDIDCKEQTPVGSWHAFMDVERTAVMGVLIEDSRPGEGNYRTMHTRKLVLEHNRFQYPAESKQNVSIRTCDARAEGPTNDCPAGLPSEQVMVSNNVFVSGNHPQMVALKDQGVYRDYIFEGNLFLQGDMQTTDYVYPLSASGAHGVTVRNNIMDMTHSNHAGKGVHFIRAANAAWVYSNTAYWGNNGGNVSLCVLGPGSMCSNNLLYAPNAESVEIAQGDVTASHNMSDGNDYDGSPFVGPIEYPSSIDQFLLKAGTTPVDAIPSSSSDVEPVTDAFGRSRPQGQGFDVGAHELAN